MADGLKATGIVTIFDGKKENGIISNVFNNLVLDVSKKGLLNLWNGDPVGYGSIDYLVIGDGTTQVTPSDATLSNEIFRKPITDRIVYGSNRIVIDTFIENIEANFTWQEIGLVSGGTWQDLGSGILLNRALVNEEKNTGKAKTISWEITLN